MNYRYVELGTVTTMGLEEEKHLMANIQLMKITYLEQLLNPHVTKMFGLNMFKCVMTFALLLLIILNLLFVLQIYYCSNDIYLAIQYFMLITSNFTTISKMYYTLRYSGNIWEFIQLTSVHYLSYKHHNTQILEIGRKQSKSFSTISTILWLGVTISWIIPPIILTNHFIDVKVENNTYHYRLNILNLIFPVKDKYYNDHFLTYYCIESLFSIIWGYCTLTFDIILLSMSITFSYQLRTIGNSFSTFGTEHNKSESTL